MALPAPNLDDREFTDLLGDAMDLLTQRCPEWTERNPSDPGITLIEVVASTVFQLLRRLNQVPDRLQVKFLDLIGLRLRPPTPARVAVTFWLSSPATATTTLAAGTEVGTLRTEAEQAIVFATTDELTLPACAVHTLHTRTAGAAETTARLESLRRTGEAGTTRGFSAFADPPAPGDEFLIGLDTAVASGAVRLDFDGQVEGLGVDPRHPPLVWEAWTGQEWIGCELGSDETGALNRPGSIVLHLPAEHRMSVLHGERAGWLRARVTPPEDGWPGYTASPTVRGLSACTVGGTTEAVHAELVGEEMLGNSDGAAGQSFSLLSRPVLAGVADPVLQVSSVDGWQSWRRVDHFADSGPGDRHFVLDPVPGEVLFGPVLREPDGSTRQLGAIPARGAMVRITGYATGGGTVGNVAAGTVRTLKTSLPFVSAVENRGSAYGGTEGETLAEARVRGALLLRSRDRAVTAEDFEFLGREAVPEAARIRCMPAEAGGLPAGVVKVLVVPAAAAVAHRIVFADLVPAPAMLARLADRLEEVRMVGTRVLVEPPRYRGVTIAARLVARSRVDTEGVRAAALDALYRYLSPLPGGGPEGTGWPFGRAVRSGELYSLLQSVSGVDVVEDLRMFTANPVTGERGAEQSRIELEPNSLVASFEHQVRVEEN